MFLSRRIEKIISKAITQFPIVALMGPRQVGKSTLLKQLLGKSYHYITFDDLNHRTLAKQDPGLFLRNMDVEHRSIIFDEVQYVPELFSEIKLIIDKNPKKNKGRFILTGSQNLLLVKNLQETLAGRILLLKLGPMTSLERSGLGEEQHWLEKILSQDGQNLKAQDFFSLVLTPSNLVRWGGLPGLIDMSEEFIPAYFDSYIQTYLERDLPLQHKVLDPINLSLFLRLLAGLSTQEINHSHLGRELSLSSPTTNRWLQWFSESFLWIERPPYFNNNLKRLAKRSKGLLFDTGLITHLLQIHSPTSFLSHPFLGAIFESRINIEFESIINSKLIPAHIYHWRTPQNQEVDIVIEKEQGLYAFEIKWTTKIQKSDLKNLEYFKNFYGKKVKFAGIIIPSGHFTKLDNDIYLLPWNRKPE